MKKQIVLLLAIFGTFILPSCKKVKESVSVPVTGDYLIMGYAGGFTMPNATTSYYLITTTEYRKDSTVLTQGVPESNNGFNFSYLYSPVEFGRVAYLLHSIPRELLNRNGAHIGGYWPDAGYLEVRSSMSGNKYVWYFEADQTSSSATIQQFVAELQKFL